ncbi:MAG TPA: DoxX family protein [Alphaproteobacteria bacterium]
MVRLGAGLILAVHGWRKILLRPATYVDAFAKMGFESPMRLFYFLILVEFVGGLAVAVGFFTRFFAAAAAIEMAYIMFALYLPNGFSWTARGYEFVLLWGLVFVAIWLRGGGPYSVDRLLKRQL